MAVGWGEGVAVGAVVAVDVAVGVEASGEMAPQAAATNANSATKPVKLSFFT